MLFSCFGMLRLSQPASAIKSPRSTSVRYSKSSSDPTSNGSTSSHGSLKNKTTRKILKKLVLMAISFMYLHIRTPVISIYLIIPLWSFRLSITTSISKSLTSGSPSVSVQAKSSSKITKKLVQFTLIINFAFFIVKSLSHMRRS